MKTILDETKELASSTYNRYLKEAKKQGKKIAKKTIRYFFLNTPLLHASSEY